MKLKEVLKTSGKSGRIKIERKSVPIDKLDSMLNYQRDIDMAFVEEKVEMMFLEKAKLVLYLSASDQTDQ